MKENKTNERGNSVSSNALSWVHFGDLHIQDAQDDSYLDFLDLIEHANEHLAGEVDFAFLPGDSADNGSEPEYKLIRKALDRLLLPAHIITGDHDRKSGTLDLFQKYLNTDLYRAVDLKGFRLLFLNVIDGAAADIFAHPKISGTASRDGATHYNELANDGHTIYAVTRSTGQIEEGPAGFSLTTIDQDVVSWRFKELGPWPFIMITSPADEKLITHPESTSRIARGTIPIRAKVWGRSTGIAVVTCSIDDGPEHPMQCSAGHWTYNWNSRGVPDGIHRICVRTRRASVEAEDQISILVNQAGHYASPPRAFIDYENAIGAYPFKGIFGTQLGPNENGTKGPWPSWRTK